MTKPDYAYKAEILATDLCKLANQIDKAFYADWKLHTTGEVITSKLDADTAEQLRCFLLSRDERAYQEARKINKARYKRVDRLRSRIERIVSQNEHPVFLTLTFTDDTLVKTSADTRRQYVRKYLKSFSDDYVANIDFGEKKGREHYHAVVDRPAPLEAWERQCGAINVQPIIIDRWKRVPKRYRTLSLEEQQARMLADTQAKLSKYVAKLTNHAIKATTRRTAIIYSEPARARQNGQT